MEKPKTSGRTGLRVAVKNRRELLFETCSQRDERASTLVTSNLPFEEWTEVFGSERLAGALLDRLTHHVQILRGTATSSAPNKTGDSGPCLQTADTAPKNPCLPVLLLGPYSSSQRFLFHFVLEQ